MTVNFSQEVAERILKDETFSIEVDKAVRSFNPAFMAKWVGTKDYGILIRKELDSSLFVFITE